VARYRIPLLPLIGIASASGLLWLWQKFSAPEGRYSEGREPVQVNFSRETQRGF
jgi:hypothetical protein